MSLLIGVAAVLVLSLVSYLVGRLYGSAIHGTEDALTRLRRVLRVGLFVVGMLAVVAFVGGGGLDPIRAAYGHGALGDALALAAMAAAVFVAVLATYLGLFPAIRATRDLDYRTASVAARFGRWLAVFLATIALGVYVVGHVPVGGTAGLVAVGVVLVAGLYVGSARLVRVSQTTRDPEEGERERIVAACERAGFDPRSVAVVETDESEWAGTLVRGPWGYRTLFVGSHLLGAYGDDALAVQVVQRAARAERGYHEARFGSLLVLTVALVGGFVGVESHAVGLAIMVVGMVVAGLVLRYGTRVVYAADRAAADATSAETVAETYRAVTEDAGESLDGGNRVTRAIRMRPSLRSRIERLEERAD